MNSKPIFLYKKHVANYNYSININNFLINIQKFNVLNLDTCLAFKYKKNYLAKLIPAMSSVVMISSLFLVGGLFSDAQAGNVRDDIPYQTYKDFGNNTGQFIPGAENLPIYNKDGVQIGILDKAPMVDFASVDMRMRNLTVIAPGYVGGVRHVDRDTFRFGSASDALYSKVDQNGNVGDDYAVPRLNKIVTETGYYDEVEATKGGTSTAKTSALMDQNRYVVLYRTGQGTPGLVRPDNSTVGIGPDGETEGYHGAFSYTTGGTILPFTKSTYGGAFLSSPTLNIYTSENTEKSPLGINGHLGDSGSPLFAYDTVDQKWVIMGYQASISGNPQKDHAFTVPIYDFKQRMFAEDLAPEIKLSGANVAVWKTTDSNGGAVIQQGENSYVVQGKSAVSDKLAALNAGKNIVVSHTNNGQAIISLENNINQGAGSITFKSDAIVKSDNDSNWQGAGIIIEKNKTVEWQVDGVQGDALHRIGEGTLIINGTGINKGELSAGQGVTLLAQKADADGNVQAFDVVRIVSGRSKVVLSDSKQVNADNIMWGFRGGELDINGNDLIFNRIRATDYGAVLNNSSDTTATVQFNSDKKDYIYHGRVAGNIDINNQTPSSSPNQNFVFDGALDLENNQFTKEKGSLVFQGHAVIHAPGKDGKSTFLTQDDWENREFKVKQLNLLDTNFILGRNATLNADILSKQSTIKIGSDIAFVDTNNGDIGYAAGYLDENKTDKTVNKDIQKIESGASLAGERSSTYYGFMDIEDSQVIVKDTWEGGVTATGSSIDLVKGNQKWNKASELTDSNLQIIEAKLTAEEGLKLNKSNLALSDKGQLIGDIQGKAQSQIQLGDGTDVTAKYQGQIDLTDSALQVKQNWDGGVSAKDSSIKILGGRHNWDSASTLKNTSVELKQAELTVKSSLNGAFKLDAAVLNLANENSIKQNYSIGNIELTNSQFNVASNITSTISKLDLANSGVNFEVGKNAQANFSTLNVDNFNSSNSYFALNTDTVNSDKIIINKKAEGTGNQLDISLLKDKKIDVTKNFNVLLASAPSDTNDNLFNAKPVLQGFSDLTPELKTQVVNNQKEWRLSHVVVSANENATTIANNFLNSDYNYFIHNLGNLDQRFGTFRRSKEHSVGAWGRVKTGKGEFLLESTDKYNQYQLGFDQQLEIQQGTLIAGLVGTMTQGDTSSSDYKINAKSYGAGVYGTYLSDTGAYIDILGQYTKHRNDYNLNSLGMKKTKADYHSIQLETDVGYRFNLADNYFIEPQAKLAYANISGKKFTWLDGQDLSMNMSSSSHNLLIGRTGLHVVKFIDTDHASWKIHMGVDYERDLINTQKNRLSDRISTYYSEPEKDDRILVSFGSSIKIKDKLNLGLDVERSFGGSYNIKNALNFNLKYTFK